MASLIVAVALGVSVPNVGAFRNVMQGDSSAVQTEQATNTAKLDLLMMKGQCGSTCDYCKMYMSASECISAGCCGRGRGGGGYVPRGWPHQCQRRDPKAAEACQTAELVAQLAGSDCADPCHCYDHGTRCPVTPVIRDVQDTSEPTDTNPSKPTPTPPAPTPEPKGLSNNDGAAWPLGCAKGSASAAEACKVAFPWLGRTGTLCADPCHCYEHGSPCPARPKPEDYSVDPKTWAKPVLPDNSKKDSGKDAERTSHGSSDYHYVPAEQKWPKACVKGDPAAGEMCDQARPMMKMMGVKCATACSCYERGAKCGEEPDQVSEKTELTSNYVREDERWPTKCVQGDKVAAEMCEQAKPMLRQLGMTCAPACSCFKYGYKCGEGPTKDFSKEPPQKLDTEDDSDVADEQESDKDTGKGSQVSNYVPPEERWPNKCVKGDSVASEMCERARPYLQMTGVSCADACNCYEHGEYCNLRPVANDPKPQTQVADKKPDIQTVTEKQPDKKPTQRYVSKPAGQCQTDCLTCTSIAGTRAECEEWGCCSSSGRHGRSYEPRRAWPSACMKGDEEAARACEVARPMMEQAGMQCADPCSCYERGVRCPLSANSLGQLTATLHVHTLFDAEGQCTSTCDFCKSMAGTEEECIAWGCCSGGRGKITKQPSSPLQWPHACIRKDPVASEACDQALPWLKPTGTDCADSCSCYQHGVKCPADMNSFRTSTA